MLCLVASGGHTSLFRVGEDGRPHELGRTRDDAAGEAFDKVARLLGLPYPGGPALAKLAEDGDADAWPLPTPLRNQTGYDFSFSGLKTAVALAVRERADETGRLDDRTRADLAASFQAAVVDVLVQKTLAAVAETGCRRVVVGGGVAASRALRAALAGALGDGGALHTPPPRLATDNAAMIARAARFRFACDGPSPLDFTADARMPMPGLERAA